MRTLRGATLVVVGLATFNATAQEPIVFGAGNSSCGAWSEAHKGSTTIQTVTQEAWVGGFLTGFDVWSYKVIPGIFGGIDSPGLFAWITNYCQSHPLGSLAEATAALVTELRGRVPATQ